MTYLIALCWVLGYIAAGWVGVLAVGVAGLAVDAWIAEGNRRQARVDRLTGVRRLRGFRR